MEREIREALGDEDDFVLEREVREALGDEDDFMLKGILKYSVMKKMISC